MIDIDRFQLVSLMTRVKLLRGGGRSRVGNFDSLAFQIGLFSDLINTFV